MQHDFCPHEDEYLIANYAKMRVEDLAAYLNRSKQQIYRRGLKLGLKRSRGRLDLHDVLMKAAETGYFNKNITGFRAVTVANMTSRLVAQKRLFPCKLTYKKVRYFLTAEAAEAHKPKSTWTRLPARKAAAPRAGWGPNDPAVITDATVYTIAPPPKYSYRTNTHPPL